MIAEIHSGAVIGIDGYGVSVEIDITRGLPTFTIVGMPDAAVRESRERVSAALRNNGFRIPGNRITVNLAPADIRKEGRRITNYELRITNENNLTLATLWVIRAEGKGLRKSQDHLNN